MGRDPRHDILFEPVEIGPKTLRNRFYQVPHCTGFGVEKPWSQAAHRAVKAEGGWAAVCTEYCTVSLDADETPFISARMWDDHDLAHLALVPEAAHRHGSLAGIELSHSGAHGENCETRLPPPAPSQIASDFSNITPKRMERWDIDRIVSDWVTAAIRSRDAGFDIVYVYGGHSYLLGPMLSPFYNQRDDEYGGSPENRARMWIDTLAAVREAVGSDCAIACRVAISAVGGAGIELDEGLEFVRLADHLVDLWDVHIGSIEEWSKDSGASRFFAEGWQLEWTGKAREATAKPIVGVGRLTTPDRMAEIVSSGVWDVIGAARPSIADPFLPRKVEEGRLDEIRECIGCNICISGDGTITPIRCTQNPSMGEEWRRGWHPERMRPKASDATVLVVGAGPAGLEAAMALGKRGHRVVLAEAARALGGRVAREARLPGLAEWIRVVDYRRGQLDRLPDVEVAYDSRLTAEEVLEYGFDHVAVATGCRWRLDGVGRWHLRPIDLDGIQLLTPDEVMGGAKPGGERVLVYDDDHYYLGGVVAEALAGGGHAVTFVTPAARVSEWTVNTLEQVRIQRRMLEAGIEIVASRAVEGANAGAVRTVCVYTSEVEERAADALVLVTSRLPDDGLAVDLHARAGDWEAAGLSSVRAVGDALCPGTIAAAVWDGRRYAEQLGEPLDADGVPFLREIAGLSPED